MSKTIPEKLRSIATWIEEGIDIEEKSPRANNWKSANKGGLTPRKGYVNFVDYEYRAKPLNPRIGHITYHDGEPVDFRAVEITPEVREALKQARIEI